MNGPFLIPLSDLEMILQTSEEHFQALRGSRLFITGGSGFIGKWMLAAFLHAKERLGIDFSIELLSRQPEKFSKQWQEELDTGTISLSRGDVTRDFTVRATPDFIIHAAAETGDGMRPESVYDSIVLGAGKLASLASTRPPEKLLFLSSGAVYDGLDLQVPFQEARYIADGRISGAKCYSTGKQMAESILAGVNAVSARCFAFVGPWLPLRAHYAIGNFIADALDRQPTLIRGDGLAIRTYMYPADLVNYLIHLLLCGEPGSTCNVGSAREIRIDELARLVAGLLGNPCPVTIQNSEKAAGRSYYVPDTSRAAESGLQSRIDLEDAIAKTARWATENDIRA